MQKALTPQHPLEDDRADDIDQLGGSEEGLQQLTEKLMKSAAGYGKEISCKKSKVLANSIKPRPSTIYEWIHTNQRRNISKESEDMTGASTLSHDKAYYTMGKQGHQFSYKD